MRLLVLIPFLFITDILFSQTYPRKAVIDSDTVAILRIDQVKVINEKLIDLKQRTEECNELKSRIELYDLSTKSLNNRIKIYEEINNSQKSQIENYKIINEELEGEYKKQKRKSIILKGVSITIGITALTLLLLK